MRKLNTRFVLWLLTAAVVLAGSVFTVHWLQAGSIGRALLWQANRAENEGKLTEAVKYLSRYLEFQPQDAGERAHLAEILSSEELAGSRRTREYALFQLEQVLLREPERHDSRRLLARLALGLGRAELAEEHLKLLHKALPADAELARLQAQCVEARGQLTEAAAWYRQAVQRAPQEIDNYVKLANLLRRPADPARADALAREADGIMDQLVAKNPQDHRSYLARWRYRRAHGAANRDDIQLALKFGPNDAEVLLAAAELVQQEQNLESARQFLHRGRDLHPQDVRFVTHLANVELAANRHQEAIAQLKKAAEEIRGPGQMQLLWTLGNILLDHREMPQAKAILTQMQQLNASSLALDYMRARLLLLEGQWAESARLMERLRPQLESSPELARHVDRFLGQCYEQLAEPGRQLEVYRRLVQGNPASVLTRQQVIAALQAAGRLEDAILECRALLKLPNAPAESEVTLARLLIMHQVQRGQRDWREVEDLLRKAEQRGAVPERAVLARAELLLAQDKTAEAQAVLEKARGRHRSGEIWILSAALADRAGKPEEARRLLDDGIRQFRDKAELWLARAAYAVERREPGAEDVLGRMEKGLPGLQHADQARLLHGLAECQRRLGRRDEARRLARLLADRPEQRQDLRIRLFLFELALQENDDAGMKEALADIQRIEGDRGPFQRYCEATRLLARASDAKGLEEARNHLEAAAAQRPHWPVLLLARGEVEDRLNNPKQALLHYRRAYELGERHPQFLRKLIELLQREQQYAEAERILRQAQQAAAGNLGPDLQRLAVEIAFRGGDSGRALGLIEQMKLADSADYKDHLWLGQLIAANASRAAQAETHLRKAVELAADRPETWIALVQHLARAGKKKEAEAVTAAAKTRLQPKDAPLTVARCHEALGQVGEAAKLYQEALAGRPTDADSLHAAAGFYLRWNRGREAEPLLRALAEGKVPGAEPHAAWARRGLAMVLATSGDHRQFATALELVGIKRNADGSLAEESLRAAGSYEEKYAQARVLATQPRRSYRLKAAALLEDLQQRHGLSADDQFLLARLYEDDATPAHRTRALELLRELASAHPAQPEYLSHCTLALLRGDQPAEAQRALDALIKLEKSQNVEPGAFGSVELHARLLEARGEGAKAIALLEQYVARSASKPERVFALVEVLARQKRSREALDRCEPAWDQCPPEMVAAACTAVLRLAQPGPEDFARVERWLQAACAKHPASVGLRMHLARVCELQEQFAKAEVIYTEVLQREPDNIVALNNLAWILAQEPARSAKALALIRQAIDRGGPAPNLLDTRAAAYLSQGQVDLAVRDLEIATADHPSAAGFFRLARAQLLANRRDAALAAFQKARSAGLEERQLHPRERLAFLQMARDFGVR